MMEAKKHVCCALCHMRGVVDFRALQSGNLRKYILDGERLTQEEYDAHPRAWAHFEIVA